MQQKHKRPFYILATALFLLMGGVQASALDYMVKSGDNLYNIAKKHDCTVADLMHWNNLKSSLIHPKQVLKIGEEYIVQAGDTLSAIAQKASVPLNKLKAVNGKQNSLIYAGDVLTLPIAKVNTNKYQLSKADIDLMAKVVYGESRGEPYQGQVAVAAVILNRLESHRFADSIKEIIYAPRQFSVVDDNQINLTPNEKAYEAVSDAISGIDPTNNALYFWNPKTAAKSSFLASRDIQVTIGNHVFAR